MRRLSAFWGGFALLLLGVFSLAQAQMPPSVQAVILQKRSVPVAGASFDAALWLKADAGTSVSGTTITGWTDQSGNARDVGTIVGTPTLTAGVQNGLPGILFTHSPATALKTSSFTLSQPFMVFVGLKTSAAYTSGTHYETVFDDNAEAGGPRPICFLQRIDSSGGLSMFGGTLITTTTNLAASTPYYLSYIFTNGGGADKMRLNGVDASGASGTSAGVGGITTGVVIGSSAALSSPDAYVIEEFVIQGTSVTDLLNAEAYLKGRLGL